MALSFQQDYNVKFPYLKLVEMKGIFSTKRWNVLCFQKTYCFTMSVIISLCGYWSGIWTVKYIIFSRELICQVPLMPIKDNLHQRET